MSLKDIGIEVQYVTDEMRGARDEEIVERAKAHGKIIVTNDKDFGRLAISMKPPGLILIRAVAPQKTISKLLRDLIKSKIHLYGYIIILEEHRIRHRPIRP